MLGKVGFRNFNPPALSQAFSPAELFAASEPGAWYDPSDLSTMFQDSAGTTPVTTAGQPVGLILDKSGRGINATQSTPSSRPLYQVENGLSYLSFDGVDDFMVTSTITPETNNVQVFSGVRKLQNSIASTIAEMSINAGSENGTWSISGPNSSSSSSYAFAARSTIASTALAFGFSGPITNVLTGLGSINGASSFATLRVNGTQVANSTTNLGTSNFLAYPMYIGRRGGTSRIWTGRIYGLIVRYGPNLSASTITNTETWMNGKTGAY